MRKQAQNTISTIIAGRQEQVRSGLQTMLGSFSHIQIVGACGSCEEVETCMAETRPDLLVLTATCCGEGLEDLLEDVRDTYPAVRCIVIADNPLQQDMALSAGAHAVLMQGFLAVEMLEMIEMLMFNMRASLNSMSCEASYAGSVGYGVFS